MTTALLGLGALAAVAAVFALFVSWERRGLEHHAVLLLLALIVVEVTLYNNQDTIPRGVFHPGSGSFQFRLPEVLITLALLARLAVHGRPRRIGGPALAWCAWAAWMAVAAVEGILRHNSMVQLPYELKAVVYLAGGYALSAGIPIRRFLDGRGLDRLIHWSALAATALVVMRLGHVTVNAKLPALALSGFGTLSGDSGGVFVALAMVALLLELSRPRRSVATLLSILPLVLSAFLADQRAVLVELGAAVVLVLVALTFGGEGRRRLRVTGAQVAVTALAVVGVVLGAAVIPAVTAQAPVQLPLATQLTQQLSSTVNSTAKVQSAQDRTTKWHVAIGDARQHPILGQGLGFEYSYFEVGPDQYVVTDITENIFLDLWLWTGAVGVILFMVALGWAVVDGLRAWQRHPDPVVGALALALVAVTVGFFSKGQVESIFEKYRLATVMGLTLGMLRAAVTARTGVRIEPPLARVPERT